MSISPRFEAGDDPFSNIWSDYELIDLIYGNVFLHFFEMLGFKKIWEIFCTAFVNYFMKILRIKLFQDDFGKTVVNFQ